MSNKKRVYLNCPYSEKELCKGAGGRWDPAGARQRAVPHVGSALPPLRPIALFLFGSVRFPHQEYPRGNQCPPPKETSVEHSD